MSPSHKQPTVNEWPLVALFSYWSVPQWVLLTGKCQWGTWGSDSVKCRCCGGHQVESAVRGGFRSSSGGPPAYSASGKRLSWRAQGTDWGLHPTGLQRSHKGPPLVFPRPWGSGEPLSHPCLCDLTAVAVCLGYSLWDLVSRFGRPEETEGQLGWVSGSLRDDNWLDRMWEPGPEGDANWDLPPLSQDWDLEGWKLCLGTLPFLPGQRITFIW